MMDMFLRLGWFAMAAVAVCYATCIVGGYIANAQASGVNDPIPVRDELGPDSHLLSGILMVPSPCDQLMVQTQEIAPDTFKLAFETWRDPSVSPCPSDQTARNFQAQLFAPATGVTFVATMNGAGIPIAVLPVTSVTH